MQALFLKIFKSIPPYSSKYSQNDELLSRCVIP